MAKEIPIGERIRLADAKLRALREVEKAARVTARAIDCFDATCGAQACDDARRLLKAIAALDRLREEREGE